MTVTPRNTLSPTAYQHLERNESEQKFHRGRCFTYIAMDEGLPVFALSIMLLAAGILCITVLSKNIAETYNDSKYVKSIDPGRLFIETFGGILTACGLGLCFFAFRGAFKEGYNPTLEVPLDIIVDNK